MQRLHFHLCKMNGYYECMDQTVSFSSIFLEREINKKLLPLRDINMWPTTSTLQNTIAIVMLKVALVCLLIKRKLTDSNLSNTFAHFLFWYKTGNSINILVRDNCCLIQIFCARSAAVDSPFSNSFIGRKMYWFSRYFFRQGFEIIDMDFLFILILIG